MRLLTRQCRHDSAPVAELPVVPTGRGFIAMLEAFRASGGAAPGYVVGQLLSEYRVGKALTLTELIETGQVFGFVWRANLWIPMFQFKDENLALKTCAQQVRRSLPLLSGWALAAWFATPNPQLNGRPPVQVLDSDLESVLLATRAPSSATPLTALQEPWTQAACVFS